MRSDARIAAIVVVATAATVLVGTVAPARAQQPEVALLNGLSREVACAPASPLVRPATPVTVIGGRDRFKTLFAVGDAVIIRGGNAQGLKAGDEFFVRRVVDDKSTEGRPGVYPISIHAAGAVQIVEAQADASIAVVTYSCDNITEGDYLERYQRPVIPAAQVGTTPDFAHPGRLILGAERRQMGTPGNFMVADRGSDHGLRPGQQITVFRRTVDGGPVLTVGTATVYSVQPESSVLRVERSIDAVYVGDLVAIHR
jgi:hypothetical protein